MGELFILSSSNNRKVYIQVRDFDRAVIMDLDQFVSRLESKFGLTPLSTPTLISHPVILAGETFAKGVDSRVQSYALIEVEEEHIRELTERMQGYKEIQAVAPGPPMPYAPDPRIILPYNGKLDELDLMIGLMSQTRVEWKDTRERLGAVIATIGKTTRIQHPQRTAYAINMDGAAIYFQNGVITSVTARAFNRDFMAVSYFLPPEMDVNKINPPYQRLDEHLAYPRDITDLEPLIHNVLKGANQARINYAQRRELSDALTRTHQLTLMFADTHRELS